jgi:hypothetical protein
MIEYFELGKEFPFQDLMLFLSGVIKKRGVAAKYYDPNMIQTDIRVKEQKNKKEIEDKLIVDPVLGWDKKDVYDACLNYVAESYAKLPVLIDMSEDEKSFLSLLATRFYWHLYKKHQKSDIGRLYRNTLDILKEEKDFVEVKSSMKDALTVWGLSEWGKKISILEKEAIEKLKIKFPSYAHLKNQQNPYSTKSAPLIYNEDLKNILFEVFEEADQYLYFQDIFEIIKDSISYMEKRVISASQPIGSIDKREKDEETGRRKFLFIDSIQGIEDTEEKSLEELSESYWHEPVHAFIDNLKPQEEIILHDFLILGMIPKQIADKNDWWHTTVGNKLKIIIQKIKHLGKGDRKETETIIGLIKINLSKTNY